MAQKVRYRTRQMSELLSYLKTVQGRHVTVNDICQHFKERDVSVGTATVYRHLERMVDQGVVVKYAADSTGSACFQYVGELIGGEQRAVYHCKCEVCGKLTHLECDEVAGLKRHLLEHHGFGLNPARTVFYGICGACRES